MNESVHQQIIPLIERSERILICTHRKPDGDAVGSIMALTKALNLLGKEVTAACADEIPDTFHFLPDINLLHKNVAGGKDFVVTLDCDKTEVDRLKYHLEDNKIHIVITPKNGQFMKENVSCHEGAGNYDLIITVDVADIPQLGKLYEDNSELFASVPVVNIDHHISNTQFGKINHVDVAASSTAEILHTLIRDMEKHFGKTLITADVATFLLSGVTTDTGSFQNANTTPKSMEVAADLMEAGANQHDVIKYLFRTKKLSTLKLWGKILTKIEVDTKHRLVWSSINQQELQQAGAHMDEAGDIIDELLVHAPEAEMVALFKEDEGMISVSFRSTTAQANVMEIAKLFGGGGHVQASGVKFTGKTLPEVMNQVIAAMQSAQQNRLGLEGIQEAPAEAESKEITQVLDGYTASPASVQPTLEQRAEPTQPAPQQPLAPSGEVPVVPAEAPGGTKDKEKDEGIRKNKDQGPTESEVAIPRPSQGNENPNANDEMRNKSQMANSQEPIANGNNEQGSSNSQVTSPNGDTAPSAPQNAPQTPTGDLHHQAKAAIQAEQSQASNQTLQTPSSNAVAQRPAKPQVEQRFNEEVPNYLKGSNDQAPSTNVQGNPNENQSSVQSPESSPRPSTLEGQQTPQTTPANPTPPAAPQVNPQAQTTDHRPQTNSDGVSVSYGNNAAPAPAIPENSAEPVVKTIQPSAGSNDQGPNPNVQSTGMGGGGGQQSQTGGQQAAGNQQGAAGTGQQQGGTTAGNQQGAGTTNNQQVATNNQPATPPTPPKDPFATGDDGLTDIERALGGL
jgi:phosphoesterase RecJ-like protein